MDNQQETAVLICSHPYQTGGALACSFQARCVFERAKTMAGSSETIRETYFRIENKKI